MIESFPSGTLSRIGPSGIRRQGSRVLGSASAAAFTPASLTGLTAWYKADAGTSSTVNGTALSAWNDQSGNGNNLTQATGVNQPTYQAAVQNGLPIVRFSAHFMDAAGVSVSQPDTIWIVAKNTAAGGSLNVIDGITVRQAVLQNGGHVYSFYAGLGPIDSASNWGTTSFHYISTLFNGASSLMRSDGIQVLTGNPGANALTGLRVGAFQSASAMWQGDVGEIVVATGDQTAQFSNMETYLKNRWGL